MDEPQKGTCLDCQFLESIGVKSSSWIISAEILGYNPKAFPYPLILWELNVNLAKFTFERFLGRIPDDSEVTLLAIYKCALCTEWNQCMKEWSLPRSGQGCILTVPWRQKWILAFEWLLFRETLALFKSD